VHSHSSGLSRDSAPDSVLARPMESPLIVAYKASWHTTPDFGEEEAGQAASAQAFQRGEEEERIASVGLRAEGGSRRALHYAWEPEDEQAYSAAYGQTCVETMKRQPAELTLLLRNDTHLPEVPIFRIGHCVSVRGREVKLYANVFTKVTVALAPGESVVATHSWMAEPPSASWEDASPQPIVL
jgi:hypothetical protein